MVTRVLGVYLVQVNDSLPDEKEHSEADGEQKTTVDPGGDLPADDAHAESYH